MKNGGDPRQSDELKRIVRSQIAKKTRSFSGQPNRAAERLLRLYQISCSRASVQRLDAGGQRHCRALWRAARCGGGFSNAQLLLLTERLRTVRDPEK